LSTVGLTIREATPADEGIIAEHLCLIAVEFGLPAASIRQDGLEQTLKFIARARQDLQYKGFIAEVNNKVIGSASCQVLELYPMVSRDYQKGYIWGLYVHTTHRRQGIATALIQAAMAHLKAIGCTKAVLHASDTGRLLYAKLGYSESNEMVLDLG
jgi:ribosomal protein S18 acetylase RimI-like enzyme